MSDKNRVSKAKREEKEKKTAEKVVLGIIIALIVLGLIFMAVVTSGM